MKQIILFTLLSLICIQCTNNEIAPTISEEMKLRYKSDSSLYSIVTDIQNEVGQNFYGNARIGNVYGECKIRLIKGLDTALINAQVFCKVNYEQFGANYQSRTESANEEYAFYGFSPIRSDALEFENDFISRLFPVVFKANASGRGDYGKHSNAYFAVDTVSKELTCIIKGHGGGFTYMGTLPLSALQLQKAIDAFKALFPPQLLKSDYEVEVKMGYQSNGYGGYVCFIPYQEENFESFRILSEPDTNKLLNNYADKPEEFYKIMFFHKSLVKNKMGEFYSGDIYNADSVLVIKDCFIFMGDPWVECENWPDWVT